MKNQEAVMAFSQSEKIKAGLIWVSSSLEVLVALPEPEKIGAEKMIKLTIGMLADEVRLAGKLTNEDHWGEADKHMDKALVMINSGVAHDAGFHLTRALSQVTTIGQRAMTFLRERDLI
ncbi:MAG: hypothetical protein GY859_19125 [Desulfobacterales bacterium]|nr:hypothetical protein [Desulfobacterales bacterium]